MNPFIDPVLCKSGVWRAGHECPPVNLEKLDDGLGAQPLEGSRASQMERVCGWVAGLLGYLCGGRRPMLVLLVRGALRLWLLLKAILAEEGGWSGERDRVRCWRVWLFGFWGLCRLWLLYSCHLIHWE